MKLTTERERFRTTTRSYSAGAKSLLKFLKVCSTPMRKAVTQTPCDGFIHHGMTQRPAVLEDLIFVLFGVLEVQSGLETGERGFSWDFRFDFFQNFEAVLYDVFYCLLERSLVRQKIPEALGAICLYGARENLTEGIGKRVHLARPRILRISSTPTINFLFRDLQSGWLRRFDEAK
jgi:hypothetical protein